MRDLGDSVLTWADRLTREQCRWMLTRVAAQHHAFLGAAPDDLTALPDLLALAAPDRMAPLGYTFTAVGEETRVTESWEFLPGGIAMFKEKFGADAQTQISSRTKAAHDGIPVTLAALKRTAESG